MSRSNPNKKKRRVVKKTLFLYCEGSDEKAFLNYLKMLFSKDKNVSVKIKENHGGSANDALRNVLRKVPAADVMVCVYDTDKGVDRARKKAAQEEKIICVENVPCLESFLLGILENKDYTCQKTHDCKKRFEENYLDKKKRKDKRNYGKIFPKKLLIERSQKNENLKIIIDLMSGKL